jgi:osmoprotectant transport system ATP-binding protein
VITFDRVTKRYPDGTVAVDALSLEIPAGQTMVLVGPSGCGKTTSLRMINRLIEPTEGTILIDGRDVLAANPAELRRGIGYVIQQTGLFPHRTIEDNIATVPLLNKWSKAKARARSRELMELVGLDLAMAKRYPHQLSGGQQQRVGVARALAADPPVLLMDEPFSAVDPIVRATLQDELIRLQAELHKTIVMVTHDVEEAIKVGDIVAVFRPGGHLAQVDTPERLLGAPADDYVTDFVGFDRGIRRLSFFGADGLDLDAEAVVGEGTLAAEARALGLPWILVIDSERRPRGWAAAADLASLPDQTRLADAPLAPIGHTFRPGHDSLRSALDATVLSRTERAVGVAPDGTVLGVTTYERLRTAIRAAEENADAEAEAVAAATAPGGGAAAGTAPAGAAGSAP